MLDKGIVKFCLWGADIKSIDFEGDKFLIIERVLEHGSDKQIEFILSFYKKKDITKVIMESSYLNRKTVNYWCLIYNLRKENSRCYTRQSLYPWPPS